MKLRTLTSDGYLVEIGVDWERERTVGDWKIETERERKRKFECEIMKLKRGNNKKNETKT